MWPESVGQQVRRWWKALHAYGGQQEHRFWDKNIWSKFQAVTPLRSQECACGGKEAGAAGQNQNCLDTMAKAEGGRRGYEWP